MLQDCSSIFTAARYVTIANKISDPLNFEYIYISTRLYSVRSTRALHSQRRISLRGWKTAQNWKKKKKSRELYVPFPRSATTAFTASSFNVLFHISPKRSETRRKCIFPEEEECAFHSPRIQFSLLQARDCSRELGHGKQSLMKQLSTCATR